MSDWERPIEVLSSSGVKELRRLQAENAKLREELEQWHRLTAGIELPEYPITEFKPKDLERENTKLRELVSGLMYCAGEAHGMCARTPIGGGKPFTCCPIYDYDSREYGCVKLKRDLGIEVDG